MASMNATSAKQRFVQNSSTPEKKRQGTKEFYTIVPEDLEEMRRDPRQNRIRLRVFGSFDYPPLRGPDHIRLLHLEPLHHETPQLRGSLRVHKLDRQCEFEAISYAWGDYPISDKFIGLGHQLLKITENLYAALIAYSYPDRTRVLWVDAICINQADASEKAQQVSIMADIYSTAKTVQVWLAPASDFTSDATRFMAVLSMRAKSLGISDDVDQPRFVPSFPSVNMSCSDAEKLVHDAIEAHVDFLLFRSWFRRVWIVQELTLVTRVVVSCGNSRMSWRNFARALEALRGAIRQVPHGEERSRIETIKTAWTLVRLRDLFRQLDEDNNRSHHVMTTLFGPLMSSNACSDDRDRVYAMLALMNSPFTMTPDYEKTVAEAYTEFTRRYSPNTQIYLAGLCRRQSSYAGLNDTVIDTSDRDYLPSWVPEFRPPRNHAWASPFDGSYKTASAIPLFFLSHPEIPNTMCVTGTIFDIIGGLTLKYEQKKATKCADEAGFFFSLIEQLQEIPCVSSGVSNRPTSEPLWLILAKTLTSGVSDCENAEFILTRYHHFDSLKHLKVGSLSWLTAIWKCFTIHCIAPTGEVYQHILLETLGVKDLKPFSTDGMVAVGFLSYLANILVPNRLFVTFDGYMGLAPSITRSGDMVAILNGCAMPYVVRSAGIVNYKDEEIKGALQVIGPCYVQGIMKGEVVEKRDSPQTEHLKWTKREPDSVDSLDGWLMLI